MRMTLCHDDAIRWAKAKVHVYFDSVSCLEETSHPSEANARWILQIQYFQQSNEYAELFGIDGEPIEFEWNISQDSHRLRFSERSIKIWKLDK